MDGRPSGSSTRRTANALEHRFHSPIRALVAAPAESSSVQRGFVPQELSRFESEIMTVLAGVHGDLERRGADAAGVGGVWNRASDSGILGAMSAWFVYLIRASDDVIYTGITTDVERRFEQHVAGSGAKFLRGRGPLRIVFRRRLGDRSLAQRVEARLKKLTRADKERLVQTAPSRQRLIRMLENGARR
jgi:putative endonuclease